MVSPKHRKFIRNTAHFRKFSTLTFVGCQLYEPWHKTQFEVETNDPQIFHLTPEIRGVNLSGEYDGVTVKTLQHSTRRVGWKGIQR
jgi:hypothetical protein